MTTEAKPSQGGATDDRLQQARRHVRNRRYGEAVALFESLLAENDADPSLHDALGSTHFLAGDNAAAARHFERVTRLVTQPGKALINLGAVYNRVGDHQKAVDSIRKGLQYERRSAEGYYNLGVAHRKLGQHPLAVTAYGEAIRLDPNFAEAYQNLGNVLLSMGQADKAVLQYRKALQVRPGFERAAKGLAEAEQAAAAARGGATPFGRLVDPARRQFDDGGLRSLSDEERADDRRQIHELSRQIEFAAQDWLTLQRGEFEKTLAALDRRILTSRSPGELEEASEAFGTAMKQADDCRRRLRRLVLELVAHEELLHGPE